MRPGHRISRIAAPRACRRYAPRRPSALEGYPYYDSPPNSPSILQEQIETEEHEKEMAKFSAKREAHQKKEKEYQQEKEK